MHIKKKKKIESALQGLIMRALFFILLNGDEKNDNTPLGVNQGQAALSSQMVQSQMAYV